MPSAKVQFKGPFFEASTRSRVLQQCEADIRRDVEQAAVDLVQALLDAVLKHPTGYYRSRIRSSRTASGATVTDSNVIYGRWLEGTGSMNYPVTRFKGYHTFKRANQILPEKAHAIARRHVTRAVMRLN
jgi:hypothetical protein